MKCYELTFTVTLYSKQLPPDLRAAAREILRAAQSAYGRQEIAGYGYRHKRLDGRRNPRRAPQLAEDTEL